MRTTNRILIALLVLLAPGLVYLRADEAAHRWTAERANDWSRQTGWLVGCNFIPSTAINELEMWQAETFDPETIDRELGWAQGLGFDCVRVFLHDLPWQQDSKGFLDRLDQFVALADKHHIKVMFVLFDSCWDPNPKLGKQHEPRPFVHNSGWVQCPGRAYMEHPERLDELKPYVQGVVGHFRNDKRIAFWDLFNEPDNMNGSSYGKEEPANKKASALLLLKKTFVWAREMNPSQPLTSGVWGNLENLDPMEQVQLSESDIITFHNYGKFENVKELVQKLRDYGRPLICTEYMARPMGSTFNPVLGYFREQNIGAFNWGFVSGKSQTIYPWDSWNKHYTSEPPVWFHDIFHKDGAPYDPREVRYIRSVTMPGPSQFVNLFIGTAANPQVETGFKAAAGNTFPGAVCPRGMLAWSPDTTQAWRLPGGYWYADKTIRGFSLTHFSGRGMMYLMDVPFMPVIHAVNSSPGTNWEQFAAPFSHANETAAPGYYRVTFDNGIQTELTATPRTGMARFTFPAQSPAALLIRAGSSVSVSNQWVTGFCTDTISGGKRSFTVYFAAEFDRPFQSVKTWLGGDIRAEANASGKNCGAILTFDTATNPVVQARVGISYVSVENARANLAQENPGWDFAAVRQMANTMWNAVLNHIQVEGGNREQKQVFYTALYHCFMHPNLLDDANGQYPGMDDKIISVAAGHHQYQNIPAWDEYRSLAPLIAILTPSESSDIAQSLVNYAQQDAGVRTNGGGLPRWEQVNHNSSGMVGDGDDIIIASAYAYGANQFDAKGALAAMDKGASQPGTTSDGFEVRRGLKDYLTLGYVPGAVSVTLEYCNADFALAQFANALGDREKYRAYQNRAQNWKNLFDNSTSLLRPKNADGSWATDFSLIAKKGFTEGTPAQYVWMVNFNLQALIDKMGGQEKALARLNHFFTKLNSGFGAETAYMGNEPCEGTPWVYDFAGIPASAQKTVRRIQDELFTTLPSGLPGNDNAGALSSWYVFSALGLYPEIPGVAGFAVGSPMFSKATIHTGNGTAIQIVGDGASPENCYVQTLKLNDRDYGSVWIPWSALSSGATLNFALGDKPSPWGNDSAPPSFDSIFSNGARKESSQ